MQGQGQGLRTREVSGDKPGFKPSIAVISQGVTHPIPAISQGVKQSIAAISQWIDEHKGPSTTIQCDDYNGRWRVIAANLQWRSISWTKRGFENAALEVLHQSWEFHTDHTGHEAPFDLDALAQRYQDDVGID